MCNCNLYSSPEFDVQTFVAIRYFLSGGAPSGPTPAQIAAENRAQQQAEKKRKQQEAAAKKAAEAEARKQAALEKKRQQEEEAAKRAKKQAAQDSVKKAPKASTISLFGLGGGQSNDSPSESTPQKSPLKKQQPKQNKAPSAPRGVPTLSNWKLKGDGSITGRISGSPNFKNGELVTTSEIVSGRIDSGSVVQTGSGSKYFLL